MPRQTEQSRTGGQHGRPTDIHEHSRAAPPAQALSALRLRGRRITRQRSLIWEALATSEGSHLSAVDVAQRVGARDPELHQATIYRTLETLVEDGLLLRTDLGADRSYYELPGSHRHHHLVCTECGAVVHVHDDALAVTLGQLETATGFTFMHELTLAGRCAFCSSSTVAGAFQ